MRVLDLFSGIGGFSLGLERAGMRTVAFCEIEPYPRAVLAERWPGVPIYDDVRELTAARLAADGIGVDVICGGFPCQDISAAGQQAGIGGERSGLWTEYARLIGEIRPRYVIVENVAALLNRGMERVLGDLAALGFDAEWHCIPASHVGADHSRDRVWIVAYPERAGLSANLLEPRGAVGDRAQGASELWRGGWLHELTGQPCRWVDAAPEARVAAAAWEHAPCEPLLLGVPDGISKRVDRLHALGNAVIPQIPEIIGRAIMNLDAP